MNGEGSLNHNNRTFTADNVDSSRTALNVTFINDNIRTVYHELFDQALKNYLYETPSLALFNSGWAYYNLKNYSKALSQYQQALSKDPTGRLHPRIEKNIGLIYLKQSNFYEAKAHLEKSVKLNPSLYDAHFYLGETYLKINDNENAGSSFRQVIKLAPQTPFGQKAKEYLQSLR